MRQILAGKIMCLLCLFFIFVSAGFTQEEAPAVFKGPLLGEKPPGKTPEIFVPGFVSGQETQEMGITWMPGMKEFYFTRQSTPTDPELWSIWFSKEVNGQWTEPAIASFSGTYTDVAPFVTYDGKYLFVNADRDIYWVATDIIEQLKPK